MHTKFLLDIVKGRGHWEHLGVDENILKFILDKQCVRMWSGQNCSGYDKMSGFCECSNDTAGTLNEGNFLSR